MDERERLADRFEEQRPRLRAVAYRMLGSVSEAEDAVQEAWLRLSGTALQVARGAQTFSRLGLLRRPVLVNGVVGALCLLEGKPFVAMAFMVRGGKIVQIDILGDPERLSRLDVAALDT